MTNLKIAHVEMDIFASVCRSDPAFLLGSIVGFNGSAGHGSGEGCGLSGSGLSGSGLCSSGNG